MSLLDDIKWYLCPHTCNSCGEVLSEYTIFCDECNSKLTPQPFYCKVPSPGKSLFCCMAAYHYAEPIVNQAIINMKFNGQYDVASKFGEKLAQIDFSIGNNIDIVSCVPLSKGRKRWRGYNQSELLAKKYASVKDKVYEDVLVKIKSNAIQSTISNYNTRKENVKGLYKVAPNADIKDKTIMLFDDVYTSGATLNECAKVLIKGGAKRVVGMVIASAD